MGRPVIVIGDRMGKGQHVADGVVKAGGEAYTIPGMAADMKLGDVMKEKNADLGISFCGSGGAGALNAQNKHGYTCRYGMRSIEEGEKAIADGIVALGFGFMDKEELGERLVKISGKIRLGNSNVIAPHEICDQAVPVPSLKKLRIGLHFLRLLPDICELSIHQCRNFLKPAVHKNLVIHAL